MQQQPTTATTFPIGALVAARGRDWVVLPDSDDEMLLLKPLGGRDEEVTGILPAPASNRRAPRA